MPDEWLSFKREFGRVYRPEEELFRREVFADNLELIRRHNAEFDAGRSTFRLGVNQFADITNEEFRQMILSEVGVICGELRSEKVVLPLARVQNMEKIAL